MNIVMYVPTASGGHARYAAELLSALASVSAPHGVSLVTSRDLAPEFRNGAYDIHDVLPAMEGARPFTSVAHWAASRVLHYRRREKQFENWVLNRKDVDIVHFQECCPLFAPTCFKHLRRAGRRVFFTVHNIHDHSKRGVVADRSVQWLWKTAWSECDGLFVHTVGLRDQLSAFLGQSHPRIHVVQHGIWTVEPIEAPIDVVERQSMRTLLAFGVIRRNKGIHVLVDAMTRLPDYRATIVGGANDVGYVHDLQQKVANLPSASVEMRVRHIPPPEMASLFAGASAVVLPYTDFSSQSGVLHDALAFGVPVVVTNVGALGETVLAMGIGEIAMPGDSNSLADAIERLHEPARYSAAVEAVTRCRLERSWETAARDTLNGYAS